MKTMKVIDLYVMKAKGEEVPKKIKFLDKQYTFIKEYDKYYRDGLPFDSFEDDWYISKILNDEIEIIEDTSKEDKKIEKLKILQFSDLIDMPKEEIIQVIKEQRFKINEVIDYLKSKEDKKIEKLNIEIQNERTGNAYIRNEHGTKCYLTKHSRIIANKVNEIIKKIGE